MTDPIQFTVLGRPRPAGSKRPVVARNRRLRVVDSSGVKGQSWRGDVRDAAIKAMGGKLALLTGPLVLAVTFYLRRPKNHRRASGALKPDAPLYPTSKPDVTKLIRAIEDALTGVAWVDDALIVDQHGHKRFTDGAERAEVVIGRVTA